ncbi:MAG: hypothetical protein Q9183_001079 [Haloplaca sp. 2 TL-2023]
MDPNKASQRLDPNDPSTRSGRPAGVWRLGMTSAMSPSLVASTAPSPGTIAAYAPKKWDPAIQHSTSTPQMYPGTNGDNDGEVSSKYMSGPSTFRAPSNQSVLGISRSFQEGNDQPGKSANDNYQRNHVLYTGDDYGSPNRFVGKSPNPRDEGSHPMMRPHRPGPLGFGNIGDSMRVNDTQSASAPKSAPAQVKTFDQHRQPSSASYADMLAAQYGHPPPNGVCAREPHAFGQQIYDQGHVGGVSPHQGRANNPSGVSTGRGYDSLAAYVEIASSGGRHSSVLELDNMMSTLIELRGESDSLPAMHHHGRDNVRAWLYERIFGKNDGSSRLSREQPGALIEVGGILVTRQNLHDEIIYFLEDQLDSMTGSSAQQGSGQQASATNAYADNAGNTEQQRNEMGGPAPGSLNPQHAGQAGYRTSPMPDFQALNLGPTNSMTVDNGPREVTNASGLSEAPNLREQQPSPAGFPMMPGFAPGLQGPMNMPYGPAFVQHQQYLAMLQQQANQQSGHFAPQYFMPPPGMMPAPYFVPQQAPPVNFIPGRQPTPQTGAMVPYGQQPMTNAMGMPQFGGGMMLPPHLVHNPQMAMSPFPPQPPPWATQPPRMLQSSMTRHGQVQHTLCQPTSRTTSPANRTRGGRNDPQVPLLPYRAGSDDMFPQSVGGTSVRLQQLTRHGQPNFATASLPENVPFAQMARNARVTEWGVLKLGNIPYSLTKQEVFGLLGRNAKIVTPELGVGIHIIMDRPTGKTMDCFVEFFSHGDAQASYNKCMLRGPGLRLGDRIVNVQMSSQDELLKEMFPRAKNCTWSNGRPVIVDSNEAYNTGFKTFLTNEELLQMVTHAEKPHRSNYTQKCLQRPYECMISTLAKFPWFAVDHYTLKTRDEIYRQSMKLIDMLAQSMKKEYSAMPPHLTESLLAELLYAALNAPAFSEQQRWHLCQAAGQSGAGIRMSQLAQYWPFEVLGRKPGMDEDLVRVSFQGRHKYTQCRLTRAASTTPDYSRAIPTMLPIPTIRSSELGPHRATKRLV